MAEIQEERERIAYENEQLHLQTQELIDETKRLNGEIEDIQQYFENDRLIGLDGKANGLSYSKMKTRIEELEDLLYEIKQNGKVSAQSFNNSLKRVQEKLLS